MPSKIVEWNAEEFKLNMRQKMQLKMVQACEELKDDIVDSLMGQRSGKFYTLPGSGGKKYQASAPDEPPAWATSKYAKSMTYEITEEGDTIIGRVGSHIKGFIPVALERGWHFKKYTLAARPHLRPALDRMEKRIMQILGG